MKKVLPFLFAAAMIGCKNDGAKSITFDVAGMDTSVHPGDDFFRYANGGWMKQTKIPDDQSGWGSFYTL
ncbi:MAG TPA: M13 family peptidase, partial [Chitinophagaceae bacterium]|nr:M13 family peptidase [Chitinophagaceae bacterium]